MYAERPTDIKLKKLPKYARCARVFSTFSCVRALGCGRERPSGCMGWSAKLTDRGAGRAVLRARPPARPSQRSALIFVDPTIVIKELSSGRAWGLN